MNYRLVDYLPKNAPSTEAMSLMEEQFSSGLADTRVLLHDVSIPEALQFKEQLKAIDGVTDILWLDDAVDIREPLEVMDRSLVETYYKEGHALFTFGIEEGKEVEATDTIYTLIGDDGALAGEALHTAVQQKMTFSETLTAASILVPIIVIILILSTSSWAEPLFFLAAIGVSVLINLGTNIFLGEISFITQAVAPILQLAVSLDYAIFLLHSFEHYRKENDDVEKAMQEAIIRSFPAIIASASTTFFGFMALSFMKFEIGADLGLNLVKGIALSFISVMVFLPALTITFYRFIDRTRHRPFLSQLNKIGGRIIHARVPVLLIVLLLIVPAYMAQGKIDFTYGFGDPPDNTRAGQDEMKIDELFGKNAQLVALIPKGDLAREEALIEEIERLPYVTDVISYVRAVGITIPVDFLEDFQTERFLSKDYSRMIIQTNTSQEGEAAFTLVQQIEALLSDFYKTDTHLLGESVTLFDMKNIIETDHTLVNFLTVATIGLVLLITFRSLSYPVILLLTIQASVWINLSVPYFSESSLIYIGYLIISTVQLAATVDYAILFAEDYTQKRKYLPAKKAIVNTINEKTYSIAVSASILSTVGFILSFTSTNPIVSSIGLLLGRGALLAFLMVLFLLPGLLLLFDRVIATTTLRANYYKEDHDAS